MEKDRLAVTEEPRDVKYGAGNRVSDIVITTYGAGRVPDLSGRSLYQIDKCQTTMLHA